MAYSPTSAYQENEILNASPERLVQILYGLAIQSIALARQAIQKADVHERVRHINKAFAVLVELSNGLDFEAGTDPASKQAAREIATNYASIYDYCRRRIVEANVRSSESLLSEVESLISELQESWQLVVYKLSAERTAKFASEDVLPSESALAGCVDIVG